MTKNQIRELLQETIATVTFEKTDGTIRAMNCTLIPAFIPALPAEEGLVPRTKREENPNLLAVWDLERGDWRSFKIDSIQKISNMYPFDREGIVYATPTQE